MANAAIVPAGQNGAVTIYATSATDVVVDINGFFVTSNSSDYSSALYFYPLTPCRIADTRIKFGTGTGTMGAGETRSLPVNFFGCGGVPSAGYSSSTISLNVTAVPIEPLAYLSVLPPGVPAASVSTLNSFDGQVVANAAIVPTSYPGSLVVHTSHRADVVLDVNGLFSNPDSGASAGSHYYPVQPCRVADTRPEGNKTGAFGPPLLAAGASREFPIPQSSCGIPASAAAYVLNVTAVPSGPLSYITVWPAGTLMPVASTLNSYNGQVVANMALVPAGASGAIRVFASDATNLVVDISGYFAP